MEVNEDGTIDALTLGRTASFYYLKHESMRVLSQGLRADMAVPEVRVCPWATMRCILTGRGRGVYQLTWLSRIAFQELASRGALNVLPDSPTQVAQYRLGMLPWRVHGIQLLRADSLAHMTSMVGCV